MVRIVDMVLSTPVIIKQFPTIHNFHDRKVQIYKISIIFCSGPLGTKFWTFIPSLQDRAQQTEN